MQKAPTIIHLIWSDPIPYEKATEFVGCSDFGIYQIYGSHPAHGPDVLLYIGRAQGGSFGWRVPQHEWRLEDQKPESVRVHMGRLAGEATPTNAVWNREIELAERLLIFAHKPPLNEKVGLGNLEPALYDVHVCNWKNRASLMAEVSGLRWTSKGETMPKNLYRDGDQPLG